MLAGCATTNINGQVPIWVAAFQAILTEAASILPQLQAVGLTGNALSNASTIISEIKAALSAINAASTASQGMNVLQTVEIYINSLAPLVLPFVSLIPGGAVIGLIVAALPAIEAALNIVVTLLTPQAQTIAQSAPVLPASARYGGAVNSQAYLNLLIQRASSKLSAKRHRRHRVQ